MCGGVSRFAVGKPEAAAAHVTADHDAFYPVRAAERTAAAATSPAARRSLT